MVRRKISEVWAAVKEQQPSHLSLLKWKQSYAGVRAVLLEIGLVLITTQDELDNMPVPTTYEGERQYLERKVVVSRNGLQSTPSSIKNLLTGNSSLPTADESAESLRQRSFAMSIAFQKGTACLNQVEVRASQDLSDMLHLPNFLNKITLFENRLADMAYCKLEDDPSSKVFAGDQEKSAIATQKGQLGFNAAGTNITLQGMLDVLKTGYSLTMIGRKRSDGKPDVVWLFHGSEAMDALSLLPPALHFAPVLHLKTKSSAAATITCNRPEFRFDIGKSEAEIVRLRQRRIQIVEDADKHTLEYLNDDLSQIMGQNQKIEHESFLQTRSACAKVNCKIEHFAQDSYSKTDFRLDRTCRIQDKVGRRQFMWRSIGGHPVNPDTVDVLQVTDLDRHCVYAIAFRQQHQDTVISTFTEDELMKKHIGLSADFKEKYAESYCDLTDREGIERYINICKRAELVLPITDTEFFSNIIKNNAESFGPRAKAHRSRNSRSCHSNSRSLSK